MQIRLWSFSHHSALALLTALVITVGAASAPAQQDKEAVPAPSTGGQLVFVEPVHDFGGVWKGPDLTHSFVIRNESDEAVEILNVKPTCGCTVAQDYTKVIEPGEEGHIPLTLKSSSLRGKFVKRITVTTNSPSQSRQVLTLQGEIKEFLTIQPASLNFGAIKPNESKTMTADIDNATTMPLEISIDQSSIRDGFTAELEELDPGNKYRVKVSYTAGPAAKRFVTEVVLNTNNPRQNQMRFSARGEVVPRISVKPAEVVFSRPMPREFKRQILLTNTGSSPVNLVEAAINDEQVTVETRELSKGVRYVIIISIPRNYLPEEGVVLTLKTDDEQQPAIEVPLRSMATAAKNPHVRTVNPPVDIAPAQ